MNIYRGCLKITCGTLRGRHSETNIVSVIQLRRTKWAGHVSLTAEWRKQSYSLIGKLEGKRPPSRQVQKQDILKMELSGIQWDCVDCIYLAEGRRNWRTLVDTVINPQFPQDTRNLLLSEDLLASEEGLCYVQIQGGARNVIPLIVPITQFYCHKSI